MPIDRTSNNTARPLKPTLATSRTSKTPVTPRLAPSASTSTTAGRPRSTVGTTPRPNAAVHEDATPVKAFISSNVTPRSSSRKTRVGPGSANSTPGGTPSSTPTIASRPGSTVDYPQKEPGHVGFAVGGAQRRPRSVVGGNNHNVTSTPRLPLANIYGNAPDKSGSRGTSTSSMFFHANDTRAPEPQQQPLPSKRAPTFFYANGEQDAPVRSPTVPSPPLSAVGRMPIESQFFHADSLSDSRGSPPIPTPPPMSASPEPWSANLRPSDNQHSLRPPSPSKENIHLSYRKGASQVIRPSMHSRNSALSIISGSHSHNSEHDYSTRKSSIGSAAVRLGHGKSASLSSIDSVHSLSRVVSHDQPHIAPSPLHSEKRVVSTGSIPESVPDVLSSLPSPSPSVVGPAGKTMLEQMNELAANARRERKVLDLEISNNSLLAINRSLEKEMRKQKAELRRFRRMSRAGRFSADTISHLEEFSAIGVSELENLSETSEAEEEELEEPEQEDYSDSSFDESVMSEGALAERDEAHRLRDEKRLQIDLEKHRELLIDTQKMNQSIKRCLNWTEELIKDGQKALAYQVRVSDVQLGGRVLNLEEQADEDQDEDHKALLSPWNPPRRNPLDSPPLNADRDSGVALDGIKHFGAGMQGFISPMASPL